MISTIPSPKHGSKSRSIFRSVPAGNASPAWTATVVEHAPHRTRTCGADLSNLDTALVAEELEQCLARDLHSV
jgi:hypothetical protein